MAHKQIPKKTFNQEKTAFILRLARSVEQRFLSPLFFVECGPPRSVFLMMLMIMASGAAKRRATVKNFVFFSLCRTRGTPFSFIRAHLLLCFEGNKILRQKKNKEIWGWKQTVYIRCFFISCFNVLKVSLMFFNFK